MRSLVSVSLLSLSLVAFGVQPASAQLKINPYPTQAKPPEGRVAPSDQLDAEVVQELLARQRAREAQASPVSMTRSAGDDLPIVPEIAVEPVEYEEPVAMKPIDAVRGTVMEAPVRSTVPANPLLDNVTVIVQPRNAPEFVAPQVRRIAPVQGDLSPVANKMPEQVVTSVSAAPDEEFTPVRNALPVVTRTKVKSDLDYKALARQQLAVLEAYDLPPQKPVGLLGKGAVPSAQLESVPVQLVNRKVVLDPVNRRVESLDRSAETVPAQMQEKIAMQSMRSQQGMIVADPLEGRAGGNLSDVMRVNVDPMNEKDAVTLLEEADAILEASIVQPAVQTLEMPDDSVLKDPAGNKIVYNEDNVREAIAGERSENDEDAPVSLLSAGSMDDVEIAPAAAVPVGAMSDWQAEAGESALAVLTQWSRDAGVELVWDSEFLVNVRNSVNVDGNYEDAVAALLDQYSGLYAGIQGTLYQDEQSGQKILHVQTNDRG